MDSAAQGDLIVTTSDYISDPTLRNDLDNEHNAEFVGRLARDPRFRDPVPLAMGRFEPVEVLVVANGHSQGESLTVR
jgi:hypothetical protein